MRIFFSLKKSRLKKTREIDNEVRISKKAEMKRNFDRNQKRITLLDIQLSSLTSMVILRVPERSKLLQKMYLARAELNQLFTSNINERQQSARLTLKALLETTSTTKIMYFVP